jgi:hypothetical protein
MSDHLTTALAALVDEANDLARRLARVQQAIAMLDGEPDVPLVRPPAPSVPEPPVTLPKRETRPQKVETRPVPTETRPAAKAGRKPTVDYARVATVARAAIEEGAPIRKAIEAEFGYSRDMAGWAIRQARKLGHDIPALDTTGRPLPPATTSEPITRIPVNEQQSRDAAADTAFRDHGTGQIWSPRVPARPAPVPPPEVRFTVDDALHAIEAAS